VTRAADLTLAPTLVLAGPGVSQTPAGLLAVANQFAHHPRVRAVVPQVLRPDGRLGEAGAIAAGDGGLAPLGWGDAPGDSDYTFARAALGTVYGCAAFRRSSLAAAVTRTEAPDLAELLARVLAGMAASAEGVMYAPDWQVIADESQELRQVATELQPSGSARRRPAVRPSTGRERIAARDAACAERILVVHGQVPQSPLQPGDPRVHQLVTALRESHPLARITLVAADGFGAAAISPWFRRAGIEVVAPPRDWPAWLSHRHYHYSHVIVTETGLRTSVAEQILESQPQAAKILALGTLPHRAFSALQPLVPADEREGLRDLARQARSKFLEQVEQFDAVWCEDAGDVAFVGAQGSRGRATHVPVALGPAGKPGREGRRGLVALASPADDVAAGHEDAAVYAATKLLPALQVRFPEDVQLTVIADRPSPMVASLAQLPGVHLVGETEDVARLFEGALVCLAPYRHGVGGALPIRLALAARTPVVATTVATETAAAGRDWMSDPTADELADLVQSTLRLLTDEEWWRQCQAGMANAASAFDAERCSEALDKALIDVGLTPGAKDPGGSGLIPLAELNRLPRRSQWPSIPEPSIRPEAFRSREDLFNDPELSPDDQYQLWLRRYAPTSESLDELHREVAALPYQPVISVVTPVYNVDPELLRAAVDSVRLQVYANWELCLVDDNSTRDGTVTALAEIEGSDPRIKVTRLDNQHGIAGTSNVGLGLAAGEYVTFLDHDDLLKPHALAQVIRWLNADPSLDLLYSDEDKLDQDGRLVMPHFKPAWSPDQLTSMNYLCHLLVVRRELLNRVDGFRMGFDGSQDHDLVLRLVEQTNRIAHIPDPLYTWRIIPGSTSGQVDAKPAAFVAAKRALTDALVRRGFEGEGQDGLLPGMYRTKYTVIGEPRVSIIIPTHDGLHLLRPCIDSVIDQSTYRNYEIVVIDNNSQRRETLSYLATFPGRVARYPYPFNYSRMMNLGAYSAAGDMLLFLNNDTEVIEPDWIQAMLEHATRPEVGAVGARLYFPDGRVQHEGIIWGALGTATNVDHRGFWGLGDVVRNCTAVTGACTMMRPTVYWQVGGNDERLRVAYNDVDICMRIRQAGYEVVYTPYARLYHNESATRAGFEHAEDSNFFGVRWHPFEKRDPYYNPNFERMSLFRIGK
jgi:GT2 family glycosyltransferase/glycosyltransferase involved in cell wall biosynthesis